jgi:hypothetical protein
MNRYSIVKAIGDGTYGNVLEAHNKKNKQIVAIKKMKKKFYNWEECVKLREVQSLKKVRGLRGVRGVQGVRSVRRVQRVCEACKECKACVGRARRVKLPTCFQFLPGLGFSVALHCSPHLCV